VFHDGITSIDDCKDDPGDAVRLESQAIRHKSAPAFTRGDLYVIGSLIGLAPVAMLLPQRRWPAVCRMLARFMFAARLERRRIAAGVRRAFGGEKLAALQPVGEICDRLEAHRFELRCQILRDLLRSDWRPEIQVEGADGLQQALADGRGAILWVSPFVFADTIAKMALCRLGHPPIHLSRAIHGFSHSQFGKRWLNPAQHRVENRYLTARIVLSEHQPGMALRKLQEALAKREVVTISVQKWGSHVAELPFLNARLRIATGAPSLAWKTGAPLMPVFTIKEPGRNSFRVIIDKPLPINGARSKSEAQRIAVACYTHRLEKFVSVHPSQWLNWSTVRESVR
jgi:lauroyl/myristoyl acyltransferase